MTENTKQMILEHLEAIRERMDTVLAEVRDIRQILDRLELRLTISE